MKLKLFLVLSCLTSNIIYSAEPIGTAIASMDCTKFIELVKNVIIKDCTPKEKIKMFKNMVFYISDNPGIDNRRKMDYLNFIGTEVTKAQIGFKNPNDTYPYATDLFALICGAKLTISDERS